MEKTKNKFKWIVKVPGRKNKSIQYKWIIDWLVRQDKMKPEKLHKKCLMQCKEMHV